MDIPRPELAQRRRRRRLVVAGLVFAALALVSLGVSRLKPAAPRVERATVWIDTVKRGEMLREVRGLGTLVPEEIRWIPAVSEGRVERIVVLPGSRVKAETVILELSNAELGLLALEAESQLRAAEAQLAELRVRLESQRLDQEAATARVQSEQVQARLRADADQELSRAGLIAEIDLQRSRTTAEELTNRLRIERKRLDIHPDSIRAQLAVQEAAVEQRRALARLRRSQVQALRVRAGLDGVLQQVPVEVGQRVTPGANLARVAQPERLKAVLRIPETQARDVQIGQKATVDTRNGAVVGRVARVDPAVQNGTVTVDVSLPRELPRGARPDLTVDGTIELERLASVLFVGRPAQGQPDSLVGLFRLEPGTDEAHRRNVRLGRASVNTIEVLEGLEEGDRVILSDTSAWDAFDRIRLD
jgi:HlyD family secretion protein